VSLQRIYNYEYAASFSFFGSSPQSLRPSYSQLGAEVMLCPEDTKFHVPLAYVVAEPDHILLKRQALDCYMLSGH
jgi:hypothetical protein